MIIELQLQSTTRNQDENGAEWFESTYTTKIGHTLDISYSVCTSTNNSVVPNLLIDLNTHTHDITIIQ